MSPKRGTWLAAWLAIVPLSATAPVTPGLLPCGDSLYEDSTYACLEGYSLCPVVYGEPMQRCGLACYFPEVYACVEGELILTPQMMTHIPIEPSINSIFFSVPAQEPPTLLTAQPFEATSSALPDSSVLLEFHSTPPDAAEVLSATPVETLDPNVSLETPSSTPDEEIAFLNLSDAAYDAPVTLLTSYTSQDLAAPSAEADLEMETMVADQDTDDLQPENPSSGGPTTTIEFYPIEELLSTQPPSMNPSSASEMFLDSTVMAIGPSSTPDSTSSGASSPPATNGVDTGALQRVVYWDIFEKNLVALSRFQNTTLTTGAFTSPIFQSPVESSDGVNTSISQMGYSPSSERVANILSFFLLAEQGLSASGVLARAIVLGLVTDSAETDLLLPILLNRYLAIDSNATEIITGLLARYSKLQLGEQASTLCEKVLNISAAFASDGGQVRDNLVHLKDIAFGSLPENILGTTSQDQIPKYVNTALVPAALWSIESIAAAGIVSKDFGERAAKFAPIWEENTLPFFDVSVGRSAIQYVEQHHLTLNNFTASSSTTKEPLVFYGPAIDPDWNPHSVIRVMTLDDCLRLLLLDSNDRMQTRFLDQAAGLILNLYPLGLNLGDALAPTNKVFLDGSEQPDDQLDASDALRREQESWMMPAMAVGLGRQLDRCQAVPAPDFCDDQQLCQRVVKAYNMLWDFLEGAGHESGEETGTGFLADWVDGTNQIVAVDLGVRRKEYS